MNLPQEYQWLPNATGIPQWLSIGLKYYGLREGPGSADNPTIMEWAHGFGITWYIHDSIAWCSLFAGEVTKESGLVPPDKDHLLAAISWAPWGIVILKPFLGCYMVFNRPGGHHIGWYVGEDDEAYHVLGGNTGDAVGFARIAKSRLITARWPTGVPLPINTNKILLSASGALSTNES